MPARVKYPVLRFKENLQGQDYVVGDPHGSFDLLEEGLKVIRFDRSRDRLFSIGDNIDRGEDSARTLQYLDQSWFYSLRGNHEDELLCLYEDSESYPPEPVVEYHAYHFGGDWWLETDKVFRKSFLEAIEELPIVIEIQTASGLVGLVHGEAPIGMSWETFIRNIECRHSSVIEQALWGRTRITEENQSGVAGIERVFTGHTPRFFPIALGNVILLDTGAFERTRGLIHGALTIVPATFSPEQLEACDMDVDAPDGCYLPSRKSFAETI